MAEMALELGLVIHPSCIWRWVQVYGPELDRRCRAHLKPIFEAAADAGVYIPSACRQGLCGTCKTRLLSGSVQMTAEQGLDPDSKVRGFVLTCVGHAGGNVKLDA